ncbi:hypothetical protein Q5P01_006163 [Channa striata]|uniref:Uncharacterized protein n=1 Tax=Channa striata TaxID=64152 RepID=A0AA88SWR4_CHASR|nr:hypothetical protein Q5P01_006163 [Channa striata]
MFLLDAHGVMKINGHLKPENVPRRGSRSAETRLDFLLAAGAGRRVSSGDSPVSRRRRTDIFRVCRYKHGEIKRRRAEETSPVFLV